MKPSFTKISEHFLPTIGVTMQIFEHSRTGAMHYHFASDNTENVFMVVLRTMPHNSTGVAHILEHTALCGSKKFSVRDPFFSMLRRSMQTFMNAFTSSDWTAYPFATENKKDFDNLLQVYLDAVFFPNLLPEDFWQEGHRFDFDAEGNLVIKGVVFNEMKGVYDNVYSRLYEANKALLHPETTYHFDSGGLPQAIVNLTYEDFIAFHKKHYHPTNATFLTFGDIEAEKHQNRFEELVLKFFDGRGEKVLTTDETRLIAPAMQMISYPSTDTENKNQVHILVSWLLGSAHDARTLVEMSVLYEYLLGHSGSPLYHALESLSFVEALSPLTMLDDSAREIALVTGVVTDSEERAKEVKNTITKTLESLLENPIDLAIVEGILDSIDMRLRKQNTKDPYGLSLFLQVIGAVTHDENIVDMADPMRIVEEVRRDFGDENFLKSLIRENLLENTHSTLLIALPDPNASMQEQKIEKRFCEKKLQKMSEADKQKIRDQAQKLANRQKNLGDVNILPKLDISEISRESKRIFGRKELLKNYVHYEMPTNGVRYIRQFFPVKIDSSEEIFPMFLAVKMLGQLGFGDYDYISAQNELSKKGDISADFLLLDLYKKRELCPYLVVGTKFLQKNTDGALKNLENLIDVARFDEIDQIRTILADYLLSLKESLVASGHRTAMMRATAPYTFLASVSEEISGISLFDNLRKFLEKSDDEIVAIFREKYQKMTKNTPLTLTVSRESFLENISEKLVDTHDFIEEVAATPKKEAWLTDLGVGYCALALPTVAPEHPDAPLLGLLGKFLWDGYLHGAIRERG